MAAERRLPGRVTRLGARLPNETRSLAFVSDDGGGRGGSGGQRHHGPSQRQHKRQTPGDHPALGAPLLPKFSLSLSVDHWETNTIFFPFSFVNIISDTV